MGIFDLFRTRDHIGYSDAVKPYDYEAKDNIETDLSEVYMHTSDGGMYYPFEPHPSDVSIEVIAHHLATRARWNGATQHKNHADRIFFSVAEHSVYVSRYLVEVMKRPDLALAGLFHDGSEAYNGDLIRPLKYSEAFSKPFKLVEHKNEEAVSFALNLPFPLPREVKIADDAVCAAESEQIIYRDPSYNWPPENEILCTDNVAPYNLEMLNPFEAKVQFLDYYETIRHLGE